MRLWCYLYTNTEDNLLAVFTHFFLAILYPLSLPPSPSVPKVKMIDQCLGSLAQEFKDLV